MASFRVCHVPTNDKEELFDQINIDGHRNPARPGARAGRTGALARPSTPWTTRRHSNQRPR
eukprot:6638431-Prymnesium_polylepis.1